MSNAHGITVENLMRSLPSVFAEDAGMAKRARVIAEALADVAGKATLPAIYTRIDELDEALLDTLAYDFKVDWWNPNFTLDEKRQTLKDSWNVHRRLGTVKAVETAISAIYPGTKVQEWFAYGGEPYHFRLIIPYEEVTLDPVKHATVLKLAAYYKNLRSVLDTVEYYGSYGTASVKAGVAFVGSEMTVQARAKNY